MEENNKIVVTREYEKKMSEISPFELKDILIRLADESARKSTPIMSVSYPHLVDHSVRILFLYLPCQRQTADRYHDDCY